MSRDRLDLGAKGEKLAEKFLRRKGFTPAARNLRRKAGELDLLMWDGEELVVVEVRTVDNLAPGFDPWDKVPPRKRNQVIKVTEAFLAELPDPLPPVRFDMCVVVMNPKVEVHHQVDAFRPNDRGTWTS